MDSGGVGACGKDTKNRAYGVPPPPTHAGLAKKTGAPKGPCSSSKQSVYQNDWV
jgi:hypothetical protein